MNSWAENNISYPSLNADTPNKEIPPEEMQASGFVPTYMDKGGNLVIGDPLTAQHMNFILYDLYQKYTAALARIEALENGGGTPTDSTIFVTESGDALTTEGDE